MRGQQVVTFTASLVTRAHDGSVVVTLFDEAGGCIAMAAGSEDAGAALLAQLADALAENNLGNGNGD